jgi:N-methylhydantoinase A
VTDADVVLGYIDPAFFLGGQRRLDRDLALRAVEKRVAIPLGIDTPEAAAGIKRIIDSKMSDLIRREVIRSGMRPEDLVLHAFGGASPVHAVGYARDLGVREIVVFPSSAVFSAFGVATADIVHTRLATRTLPLPVKPEVVNADLEALEAELLAQLDRNVIRGEPVFRRYVTLRFRRQTTGEEIALPWDRFTSERMAELERLFVAHYDRLYGEGVAYLDAGLDLAGLRVDLVGPVAKPELRPADTDGSADRPPGSKGEREAWFDDGFVRTPVFDADRLVPGHRMEGPAIVESRFTTVVLPPRARLEVDAYRNLVIRP